MAILVIVSLIMLALGLRVSSPALEFVLIVSGTSAATWLGGMRYGFAAAVASSLLITLGGTPHRPNGTESLEFVAAALVVLALVLCLAAVRNALARACDRVEVSETRLDAARTANDEREAFVGYLSHELRTPITTILGNAQLLDAPGKIVSEEQRAGALADIRNEVDRLNRTMDNLLSLARFENSSAIDLEPVSVRRIVTDLAARHRRSFPTRTVDVRLGDDVPPALGSTVSLEEVLDNLISNAEKYSPLPAPIEIAVGAVGDKVEVRIRDRGEGINEAERDKVFLPFYRSARTASRTAGTGVGLAIADRLTRAQGGTLSALPRDGGGTEFVLALAVAEGGA
ncbi:MAG TPA: ATP-binding protein [Dehalococcoidia bacterium]